MNKKIMKTFRLTKQERSEIDNFKNLTGMTYSSIAEKSMLIFIKGNNTVQTNRPNAKYKDFDGETKTEKIVVYFSDAVYSVVSAYCVSQGCSLTELFIDAYKALREQANS